MTNARASYFRLSRRYSSATDGVRIKSLVHLFSLSVRVLLPGDWPALATVSLVSRCHCVLMIRPLHLIGLNEPAAREIKSPKATVGRVK